MESHYYYEKISKFPSEKTKIELVYEKSEVFLSEIFPKFKEEDKNKTKIRRIRDINFTSLIKEKIKESFKPFLDIDLIDKYNLYNFAIIFENQEFNALEILPKFETLERNKLDPVMITNLSDPLDTEFYWGEWNSFGKKEGFGIQLSSNCNFYFGTFKDDKMDGLGLYIFADKEEIKEEVSKKQNFKINSYFSKQFSELEKRNRKKYVKYNDTDKYDPLKKFIKNFWDKKMNYFSYIGEFEKNKFQGSGAIYHRTDGNFSGKFNSNKMIDGKFKL